MLTGTWINQVSMDNTEDFSRYWIEGDCDSKIHIKRINMHFGCAFFIKIAPQKTGGLFVILADFLTL